MRLFACAAAALAAGLGLMPRAAGAEATSSDAPDRLYSRYCARCHEEDFTGRMWRDVKPEIPDFTSAAWHATRSDARLLASILDGKASGMPAFRRKLSEGQARGLVALLRRAAPAAEAAPPEAGPGDFDRRYEELMREMALLKRQFREAGGAGGP